MATVGEVAVVGWDAVEPIDIGGGSWSRVLIDAATVPGTHTTFGCSSFAPGTATSHMSHDTEELAYVVSGKGYLQLDGDRLRLSADQACHIPEGVWHAVVNDHDSESLVMVFAFNSPEYPSTERRPFDEGAI